jgi:ABC-type maltose transport system permease subunit
VTPARGGAVAAVRAIPVGFPRRSSVGPAPAYALSGVAGAVFAANKSVAYVSGLAGGNMTEELDKSKTASEMTDKEKEEAAAVTGATALGCLGFVTLPFSIIAVMIMILVVVCVFMRVMHHI